MEKARRVINLGHINVDDDARPAVRRDPTLGKVCRRGLRPARPHDGNSITSYFTVRSYTCFQIKSSGTGGKVRSNRQEAMTAFLKLKLQRGESLTTEQLQIVNATLDDATFREVKAEAAAKPYSGESRRPEGKKGSRKRDRTQNGASSNQTKVNCDPSPRLRELTVICSSAVSG